MSENDISNLYKSVGIRIREFRKFRRLKTKELADRLNISEGTIRNIESGASVSLPLLVCIATELEVPIEAILHEYNMW